MLFKVTGILLRGPMVAVVTDGGTSGDQCKVTVTDEKIAVTESIINFLPVVMELNRAQNRNEKIPLFPKSCLPSMRDVSP